MSEPSGGTGRHARGDDAHVDDRAHIAADVRLGPGVSVGPGAVLEAGVTVGAGSIIGPAAVVLTGTCVGAECVVEPGAVLGKHPRLRARSQASRAPLAPLVIEDGTTVCALAVVYAGVRLGPRVIIGDQAHVRERTRIGAESVVGRGSSVEFGVTVGERVLIQSDVYVTAGAVVADDVFIGPGVCTTNDDTMGRHPPEQALAGPRFGRACRVGGGSVLVPGVEIGEEAFVAAGSVVTRDVAPRALVMGVPARQVREVAGEDLLESWR